MSKGARILVVDDDPAILRVLMRNLSARGFQVVAAATAADGIKLYAETHPDLVILDLGLPDLDGVEVIRRLRSNGNTPVIVLSVRETERDKVLALDEGADDYLTKPFSVEELLARVRVTLRHLARPGAGSDPVFTAGDLEVDLERRRVRVRGREIHLTPTEYELLRTLIAHPDRVLTDRMLLTSVWGSEYGDEAHYLHVYVARLRRKLSTESGPPPYIVTEPGVGYRLRTES